MSSHYLETAAQEKMIPDEMFKVLMTKVQKMNCYSNRSFFGLFPSRFSRYQTFLIKGKFHEKSLLSLIYARTVTEN